MIDMNKIIIIEDEDKDYRLLKRLLLNAEDITNKNEIMRFVYSDDALDYIRSTEPLIFVLDLFLPKNGEDAERDIHNGLDVFEEINKRYPLVPVVVDSATGRIPFEIAGIFSKKVNCSLVDKVQGFDTIIDEIRLMLKSKISEMRLAVHKFEEMINDEENYLERDFQKFLEDKLWFFGSARYVNIFPHDRPDIDEIVDLLLERSDGFYDIYELKRPKFPIFKEYSSGRNYLSDECAKAVGQLIEYIDSYNRDYYKHFKRGKNIYLPKGYVVIGKHNEDIRVKERLRLENSNLRFVEIITFDDILERARGAISLYQSI